MRRPLPALHGAVSVLALAFVLALFGSAFPRDTHAAGPGPFGPPVLGLRWTPVPGMPCAGDSVSLRFDLCRCKVEIVKAGHEIEGGLILRLRVQPDIECVRCVPDSAEVAIGLLNAGHHAFPLRVDIEYTTPPDSSWPASPFFEVLEFDVGGEGCGPNPGQVRYLDSAVVHPPACVGDSITLRLAGTFPSNCIFLRAVENLGHQIPGTSPPTLDTIRLLYGNVTACADPCTSSAVPWRASIKVRSPETGGLYAIPLVAYESDLCTGDSVGGQYAGSWMIPVSVADSCGPPPPGLDCFRVSWRDTFPSTCAATYGPQKDAELVFRAGSTLPIHGMQGGFRLDTPALRVAEVRAARDGWAVQATRTNDGGVNFIAFATSPGAAIPPDPLGEEPLLHVRVEVTELRIVLPDRARISAVDLLVSDGGGQAIPMCPIVTEEWPPRTMALLCREARCDANGDAHSDVRDLVVMVSCLEQPPGPWCPIERLDCDANGSLALEDVYCCGRHILNGGGPAPPDSVLREEPALALQFGLPRALPDGTIEVPLDVSGLDAAAAARFDVAGPWARYEVEAVEFSGFASNWWTAHVADSDRVGVMLLDLSRIASAPSNPEAGAAGSGTVLLRLRLRDGAAPGGELSISGFDFADPEGIGLTTPNANPHLPLGATGTIALTLPRPNPFRAGTWLTLSLPAAGPVDAAVYSAAGRRVATLLREQNAAAGPYELSWNGRDAAGSRLPGGIYFVRVLTGAGQTSRKVLFLPDDTWP